MIPHRRPLAAPASASAPALLLAASLVVAAAAVVGLHVARADVSLLLTPSQWAADAAGPTLDQMFPPNGFAMQHPVLVWWGTLELLGFLAFPIAALWLRRLCDCGFVIAKTVGVVLLAWFVWFPVSVGVGFYDNTAIFFALGVLFLISGTVTLLKRATLVRAVRDNWRLMLTAEAVFAAGLVLFILLRLWYPDLGHQFSPVSGTNAGSGRMGEKQMELAFLTATVRSRVFPPYDPFYAHGIINYYYYGYVLVGTLCKLTHIAPVVGFNLAVASLFRLLLGTVFTIGASLTRRILPGLVSALFVGLIGNLAGGIAFWNELIAAGSLHSSVPVLGGLVDGISGLIAVLAGSARLPAYDFWGPTRIIPPAGIDFAEFPYFTYLFGDLHAHLIAYPLVAALAALAVQLVLEHDQSTARLALSSLLAGLVLAALLATNPWDFPTALVIIAIGSGVGGYAVRRRLSVAWLTRSACWLVTPAALAVVFAFPFEAHYQTVFASGIGTTSGIAASSLQGLCSGNPAPCSQVVHDILATPLSVYLQQFGLFAFILLSYLLVLLGMEAGGLDWIRRSARAAQFAHYYRDRLAHVRHAFRVARRLSPRRPAPVDGAIAAGALILIAGLLVYGYVLMAFLALWGALAVLLLLRLGPALDRAELFILALVLVPLGISFLTQPFYIRDFLDGGAAFRMNTIFKFYNQVWLLLAVLSATSLTFLARRVVATRTRVPEPRPEPVLVGAPALLAPPPQAETESGQEQQHPLWTFVQRYPVWGAAFAVLLAASVVYTGAGTVARETYRTTWLPESAVPLTLDGMAFMRVAYPGDFHAITWLNGHAAGAQVIAEAYDCNSTYNWYSRVATFTGLPDIVNGYHEDEQRPFGRCVDPRTADLKTLYSTSSPSTAWSIIHRYGVRYIYVGFLERHCLDVCYPRAGLAKFDRMVGHGLRLAYHWQDTDIYEVTA